MPKKPLTFEMSADARFLVQRLEKITQPGVVVTYESLSGEVGRRVNGSSTCLQTARRHIQNDFGRVFGVVRGIGLQLLSDDQVVDASNAAISSIRKKSKREAKRLTCVEYGSLPQDKKLAHTARMSVFAFVADATSQKTLSKIEAAQATAKVQGALPTSEMLAAMTGSK